jgi:hypothetical protein
MIELKKGTVKYKVINAPSIKKVVEYVELDTNKWVCSAEWNREIKTIQELESFIQTI